MKSIMKKIFSVTMMLCISMCCMFAQSEVIKFLGIPVDGTKEEMIQKLKAKGFKSSNILDLEGEFNGKKVCIAIVTNNNKVYRVCVAEVNSYSETDIKIRFNTLCHQFENNDKYISNVDKQFLSEQEDISYEMTIHNKRYQAAYYQCVSSDNLTDCQFNSVWFTIQKTTQYGEYRIFMYYDNERNMANGEDL